MSGKRERKLKRKRHTHKLKKENKSSITKNVEPEFYFKVIDGSELKNLMELADAFERMSDDSFFYHVTEDKNDFGNWVRDIIKLEDLADQLMQCNNQLESETCILRYVIKKCKCY